MTWFFKNLNRKTGHFQVSTPPCVRALIIITVCTSLLLPVISYALYYFFGIKGFIEWAPLSVRGVKKGWIWQFVSYFFIQSPDFGITLPLLFSLFFLMFALWFAGTEVATQLSCRALVAAYLGSGIVSGIVVFLFLYLTESNAIIVGSSSSVYAILILWVMLLPNLVFSFFLFLRVQAKWLVAILLTLILLVDLSYGRWVFFLNDAVGILCGFFAGRFIWHLPNPYPFDLPFAWKKDKLEDLFQFEDDDAFMDRMLDKITRKGKRSLSLKERERMRKISEKKF